MRPDSPPALSRRKRPRGEPAFGPFFWKGWLIYAECVCREVAVAREGRAGSWRSAVRHDSLGLNKSVEDAPRCLAL